MSVIYIDEKDESKVKTLTRYELGRKEVGFNNNE
jgi:hypothetical protein